MKCIICRRKIGPREARQYINVYTCFDARRLYTCLDCEAAFDRLIDALPRDLDGRALSIGRSELEALKLATDRKRLEQRLRAARSVLVPQARRNFGRGRFNFLLRQLIGDNGMVLQWQTRNWPSKPVAYLNQQTTEGNVSYNLAEVGA